MGKPIIYVVCGVLYYDTTPIIILSIFLMLRSLFLLRKQRLLSSCLERLRRSLCGWHGEGGKGSFRDKDVLLKTRIGD